MESAYPPPRLVMDPAMTLSTTGSALERIVVLITGACVRGQGGCVLITGETQRVYVKTLPGEERAAEVLAR